MDNQERQDAESEYRLFLLKDQRSDPAAFKDSMVRLRDLAHAGHQSAGRGVVLVIDDGAAGFATYVPAESADLQFGAEVNRLCASYDPAVQWILIGLTDGRAFPIVMDR